MHEPLIDHWSYSSMTKLMRNPLAFKKNYVIGVWDDLSSPSSVVGTAAHKAIQSYYEGVSIDAAIQAGQKYIDEMSDTGINYGKTGSRENIIVSYNQAIRFFFEEQPKFYEILGVEQTIKEHITDVNNGERLSLPAKAKIDMITRNDLGEIEVIDWKFTSYQLDTDKDDFNKIIQAMFDYHVIKAKYGEAPARVRYIICKTSKNRDGSSQLSEYSYEFDSPGDFAMFYRLYNDCTKLVSIPDMVFLPNPDDIFDGGNTFEIYRSGIMEADRPMSVKKKTEQRVFVEKNFVASVHDDVDNDNLSPEEKIRAKLGEFGAPVSVQDTVVGPSVTRYTFKPSRGVSMARIAKLEKDLALALEAKSLRIQAPIPGTSLVGIEVPSQVRKTIDLGEQHFIKNTLNIPVGVDISGKVVHSDLSDMPHLLIAGTTGSGKSVMINTILTALTSQMSSRKLELVLIDPKQVELAKFAAMEHTRLDMATEADEAVALVEKVVHTMEDRYSLLVGSGARNLAEYNKLTGKRLRNIVFVIDEFADLMLNGGNKPRKVRVIDGYKANGTPITHMETLPSVESMIVRIAQKARAVGIHLVLATQRPSADVVTGLIKANIPTKIAFAVTNEINSKIILDQKGAEELTGKGDMLFSEPGSKELLRLQGLYA